MFKKIISIRAIIMPTIFLIMIWFGFLLQQLGFFKNCFGAIIPQTPEGLFGVIFSPFLHGSLEHIVSNSIPLFILTFLLYQFYPKIANQIMLIGWLGSGFLVWLTPQFSFYYYSTYTSCIIGASGVVYVLAFFLFFSGIFRRKIKLLAISLLVALYYGSLIWGMIPEELLSATDAPSKISWQSHLSGGIFGLALAYFYRNTGKEKEKKFIWEFPNYYSEKDDLLWQKYKQENPQHFEEMPHLEQTNIWKYLDEIRKK